MFSIFTAVKFHIMALWIMKQFCFVSCYQPFGRTSYLYLQPTRGTQRVCSLERLVATCEIVRQHNAETILQSETHMTVPHIQMLCNFIL